MAEQAVRCETHRQPGSPVLRERVADPCTIVIFGATGDLARRKLVPALYRLFADGELPDSFAIVGFSRSVESADELRRRFRDALEEFGGDADVQEKVWKEFAGRIECAQGNYEDPESFARLKETLGRVEKDHETGKNRLFYFAVPPDTFPGILGRLHEAGLLHPIEEEEKHWSRVVIEKPFGRDLDSACELNRLALQTLDERQIYRIDHYLGKETVQNILVFRFGNSLFEPVWNRKYIDHVQITAAEEIGIEGRGKFYDSTGVLRDVVQNHLMQILALTAMEPPASFSAEEIRNRKVDVFRSLRPLSPEEAPESTVRGQYDGYRKEPDVDPDSKTPTYAALKVLIDNWRWQGVPFYLRAGKKLAARRTEVKVVFQPVPLCLFGRQDVCQRLEDNELTLRIQPEEGIDLKFVCKVPGGDLSVASVDLDFSYARAFGESGRDAYERLLLDGMRGDATLFQRGDGVEEAWRFITPILQAWESPDAGPVSVYKPGSDGPDEARELLRRDGREWRPLK